MTSVRRSSGERAAIELSRRWRCGLKPHRMCVDEKTRSTHHCVAELRRDINDWTTYWNESAHPFT